MKAERGRDKYRTFFSVLDKLSGILSFLPMKIRKFFLIKSRQISGKLGLGIRYIIIKSIVPNCGTNISIHENVYIFMPEKLKLGSNISIHPMCYIDATGEIEINNDVSIAHGVTILSSSHVHNGKHIAIKDQGIVTKKTIINENVWIGAKSTILYGVTIKSGCIIAAHTLVNQNFEEDMIIGGIPAKILKSR